MGDDLFAEIHCDIARRRERKRLEALRNAHEATVKAAGPRMNFDPLHAMSMQAFVENYAKHDVVTYNPTDLQRGDTILVFVYGMWIEAMFIDPADEDMRRIYAVLYNEQETRPFDTWVIIEG